MLDMNLLVPALAREVSSSTPVRVRLPGLPKRKVIRIATGCTDPEQFVATFWRFCEADACFVPTTVMRPAGLEAVFALQLADGRPLVRGVGVVMAAWSTADNPFGRPGLLLGFRRLTADSRALVVRMVARRAASPTRAHADTIPQALGEAHDSATPTIAMTPVEGGVVAPGETLDRTERCEPVFADCAIDEPPRSAIATILGVAPLPKLPAKTQIARTPRTPATTVLDARIWMLACAAFAIAFVLALVSSR